DDLPLAVVAEAGGLHDARRADLRDGGVDLGGVRRRAPAGQRQAGTREEPPLPAAVLGEVEGARRRPHRAGGLGRGERRRGDVLELECDDVDPLRQLAQGVGGVERRAQVEVGDRRGRRALLGREHGEAVAHPPAGGAQRQAELAAADDADGGPGEERLRGPPTHQGSNVGVGSVAAAAASVCSRLKARRRARSSGRVSARTAAASKPAFAAPASPIASVPTGTPRGIWTIDRSESRPDSALLLTGTPRTGRWVWAASIPGRCAAPPAPATITS